MKQHKQRALRFEWKEWKPERRNRPFYVDFWYYDFVLFHFFHISKRFIRVIKPLTMTEIGGRGGGGDWTCLEKE